MKLAQKKPVFGSPVLALVAISLVAGASLPLAAAPHWVSIGPYGGVVIHLAQAPSDPLRLYAASAPAGIYRSRDGGLSWQTIDRGLEGLVVTHLAVDPTNPDVVLAHTANFRGGPYRQVWRSENGGATWSAGRNPEDHHVDAETYDVLFDPRSPGTVYAATSRGIFRSSDGGLNWAFRALRDVAARAFARNPMSPSVWIASGLEGGSIPTLYRSEDGGTTWHVIPSLGGPVFAARLFFRGEALFAVGDGALYRSTDGATTWTLFARLPTIRATDFMISPSGSIYATTYAGVYRSIDGVHWSPEEAATGQASPPDQVSGFALIPGDVETQVASGRRGIWRSTDGGRHWRPSSRNLANLPVGSLIVVPNRQGTVLGLFYDEGLLRTDRGGSTWRRLPRQAGFEVPILAPDPHRPGRVYALGKDVGISDDLGQSWQKVGELPNTVPLLLRVDPFHPNVLFAGVDLGEKANEDGFAYRSENGGATWTEILALDFLLDLAFDPTHREVVFRVTSSGVDRSADDGRTWEPLPDLRGQLLGASPSTVLVDPRTRALYLGTDRRGIFRSTDGGRTFLRIDGGLPRRPGGLNPYVSTLLLDAGGELYAGLSQAGVYRLRPGRGWTAVNRGLPLAYFGPLIADPVRPGLLYASSYGSSVYRLENP